MEGDIDLSNGQLNYCPNCLRLKHQEEAIFCLMCGTELKTISLRDNEYYTRFKIPKKKILLEQNSPYELMGFPFFLQKFDPAEHLLQVILLHEYPKCNRLFVILPTDSPCADWSEEIAMTDGILEDLLSQGFEWYHHSEMDTLWQVS